MIAGNMKVAFGEHGKEIELAIPTPLLVAHFVPVECLVPTE